MRHTHLYIVFRLQAGFGLYKLLHHANWSLFPSLLLSCRQFQT